MKSKPISLQETYKRLFKGRPSSNDKKIFNENIQSDEDFKDTVAYIAAEAANGENMTDQITDELGDYYDDVYDSGDKELIKAYNRLRELIDEPADDQAEAAQALLALLK
jgi:hypothetical protein